MEILIEYFTRLFPGLFVIILFFLLVPRDFVMLRIMTLIIGFILMRDTMTPLGLWEFGINKNTMWLRFINDGWILIILALMSLIATLIIYKAFDFKVHWFTDKNKLYSIVIGVFTAVLVAAPFTFPYFFTQIEPRGGTVAFTLLPALFIFALLGNFLEEILFRGLFQNYIRDKVGIVRSILLSGLLFSIGHTFLAISVTDLGIWILVFTFFEGLVCAVIYEKYGLIPAALTHGLIIFILSSGLV